MKIAVLGPEGSFSEKAARRWSSKAEMVYCEDFERVFDAVESGRTDAGVVPVENSLEGAVGQNMDLLRQRNVLMVGEVIVPVRHCLLGLGQPSEIKVILSHPQALAQCRLYLKRHYPGAELRTTGSTSHAAKLAQEFSEMGAIASQGTAEKYGLKVLARDIQDSSENATRFAVISRERTKPTGRDKTSLAVYLDKDRPGALFSILQEFALREINLTRIESRPSRLGLGDYYFYIDLEGHISDPQVKEALTAIEAKAARVKELGSYPRA